MRSARFVVSLSLVLFAPLGFAQKDPQTEAQRDGFAGAVKSVSTIVESSGVQWQQPGGPTLVTPIWCRDCEYSADGYRTKSGQVMDSRFFGETITLNRDPNGRVTDRTATSADTGETNRHEVLGPFGMTELVAYQKGSISTHQTVRYDTYGHPTEWTYFDGAENQVGRTLTAWTMDGTKTSTLVYGKDGLVSWRDTYDPEKDEQHFTTFDETGNVKLTFTFVHGKVTSFWEPSNALPNQFGDSVTDFDDKSNPKSFHCHSTGLCDVSNVHYEYADPAKRNFLSAEWRDANGTLLYAAYYKYAFDSNGNWTHREVSVLSPEMTAPAPYETDDRLITYWEK